MFCLFCSCRCQYSDNELCFLQFDVKYMIGRIYNMYGSYNAYKTFNPVHRQVVLHFMGE